MRPSRRRTGPPRSARGECSQRASRPRGGAHAGAREGREWPRSSRSPARAPAPGGAGIGRGAAGASRQPERAPAPRRRGHPARGRRAGRSGCRRAGGRRDRGGTVGRLLARMSESAFQGRRLGEAFADVAASDRRRVADRARPRRLDGQRGSEPPGGLARRARVRRRDRLHVGERDGGPPRAAGRARLPGGRRPRRRRGAPAGGLLPLLRPRRAHGGLRRHGGLHPRVLRAPRDRVAAADDQRRPVHAGARALAGRPGPRWLARGDLRAARRAAVRPGRAGRPPGRGVPRGARGRGRSSTSSGTTRSRSP